MITNLPTHAEARERVSDAIKNDIYVLILASNPTGAQLNRLAPEITEALARRAVRAVLGDEPPADPEERHEAEVEASVAEHEQQIAQGEDE